MTVERSRFRVSRRRFLAGTAIGAAAGVSGFPAILKAQPKTIKVGILHPVTGPIAPSGQQCRLGARLAIETINANGGIASMGGAKLEPIYADAQSKPDVGVA